MEWANEVSSRALATLEENKWNKLQLLPFAEDLSKLHQHLIKTTKQSKRLMLNKPTAEGWKQLCEVTLAQVLLFNRKRSGEVERRKIETFENRDKTAISQTEIQESLSEFERKLSQSLTLLEVRGKRGRRVPILLTDEMKVCVELLIKHRNLTGVSANNDYIFAKSKFGSIKPIRGGDVLRKFAKECHDMAVHREYYRLPQSTIYLAKVSKILLAVEKGNVQAYKGLSLDEINVDHSYISEENKGESAEECDQKQDNRGGTSVLRNEDENNKIQQGQRCNERYDEKQEAKREKKQRKHSSS
ncbi:hypothetical protein JTE90_025570 [Oedothorax gibbosus]|uniref:Uncharacterized protein n=1 Tax=Oedothorax gibbosus TaxID=931172 RepID=A0AAV6TVI2_9ARAC|nr:hypothetical protein JTE90_025570 [Oedothorax gibbosus]